MNKTPIHQNLSTSFVDVDALVRYLRGLQFVGSVHIEMCGYEADIIFTASNRLQARECDHATGLTAQGAEAFRRILVKARESHGRIHVYQSSNGLAETVSGNTHVDAGIAARARLTISALSDSPAPHIMPNSKPKITGGWDVLLNLTAELLHTVEESLEGAGLSFAEEFAKACAAVAEDYPFIHPNRGLFEYRCGSVRFATMLSRERFLSAVLKAVERIFNRLLDEPQLSGLREKTADKIRDLALRRKSIYETLGFTAGLNSLLER